MSKKKRAWQDSFGHLMMYDLSIVIPFYNEKDNVSSLLNELISAIDGLCSYEIVCVNDGSQDETASEIQLFANNNRSIVLVNHLSNRGKSQALISGFSHARGEKVATIDSDLEMDPLDLVKMYKMTEGFTRTCICGVRKRRTDGIVKILSSKVANMFVRAIFGRVVSDVGCSLRIFDRSMLQGVLLREGIDCFLPILFDIKGGRILEIPVGHRDRLHGKSHYGINNRLWRGMSNIFHVLRFKLNATGIVD